MSPPRPKWHLPRAWWSFWLKGNRPLLHNRRIFHWYVYWNVFTGHRRHRNSALESWTDQTFWWPRGHAGDVNILAILLDTPFIEDFALNYLWCRYSKVLMPEKFRKLSIFFWVKNSWKCCSFGLFRCWQLWFHGKKCQKRSFLQDFSLKCNAHSGAL